jgi:hypothetical protein
LSRDSLAKLQRFGLDVTCGLFTCSGGIQEIFRFVASFPI